MENKYKPSPTGNVPSLKTQKNFIFCLILGSFLWSLIILGLIMSFIQLGYSDNFIPDHICNERINQSFINGTSFGGEYTIAIITNEAIQCNTIPISYANYSYTLVAVECLNLNTTQEEN